MRLAGYKRVKISRVGLSIKVLGVFRAYRFGRGEKVLRICRDFIEGEVLGTYFRESTSQINSVHKTPNIFGSLNFSACSVYAQFIQRAQVSTPHRIGFSKRSACA